MKSVLFLGHYNGGKKDFDARHFFFAKELVELGYKATIINAAFHIELEVQWLYLNLIIVISKMVLNL